MAVGLLIQEQNYTNTSRVTTYMSYKSQVWTIILYDSVEYE